MDLRIDLLHGMTVLVSAEPCLHRVHTQYHDDHSRSNLHTVYDITDMQIHTLYFNTTCIQYWHADHWDTASLRSSCIECHTALQEGKNTLEGLGAPCLLWLWWNRHVSRAWWSGLNWSAFAFRPNGRIQSGDSIRPFGATAPTKVVSINGVGRRSA